MRGPQDSQCHLMKVHWLEYSLGLALAIRTSAAAWRSIHHWERGVVRPQADPTHARGPPTWHRDLRETHLAQRPTGDSRANESLFSRVRGQWATPSKTPPTLCVYLSPCEGIKYGKSFHCSPMQKLKLKSF